MSRYCRALISMMTASVLFSFGGLFLKSIEWHPLATIGFRGLVAAFCIYPRLPKPVFRREKTVYLGGVALALKFVAYAIAIQLTTVANVVVIQYTAPVFVILIGFFFFHEKPSLSDINTVAVVLVGLLLFFVEDIGFGNSMGNAMALVSGIAYACMAISMKKIPEQDTIFVMFWGNVFIFFAGLPFILFYGFPSLQITAIVGAAGVVIIALPLILVSYAARYLSAVETILLGILELLLSPVWMFFFMGEKPGLMTLVGGVVVIVAITYKSIVGN